jgi:putative Ig domain-containing protein
MSYTKSLACAASFVVVLALLSQPAIAQQQSQASPFHPSPPKTHVQRITTGETHYSIEMGGTLDMDNTMTRTHATRHIAFQNNESLTIANTGNVPVANPRVITNDRRRWGSLEEMLAEFTRDATNEQEKIYLIWEHMRQNMHHDDPLFNGDFHDPVRLLNVYGGGLCDDAGQCGAALFFAAGFNEKNGRKNPFNRALRGHMQCEVFCDGAYQFMDIDQDVFFLDRENRKPVSGDGCMRDHDIAKRELAYGPILPSWQSAERNAGLFGIDDSRSNRGQTGYRMDYTLRPGERMVFRWDNIGKWSWERSRGPHRYYGNSKIVYEPRLDAQGLVHSAHAIKGFEPIDGGLKCIGNDASITFQTSTCYTVCGGTAAAEFAGGNESSQYHIECSIDGKIFAPVWQAGGAGPHAAAVALDKAMGLCEALPLRTYYIRFTATNAPQAQLAKIHLETDITASPMALPRLNVGMNAVEYTDDTKEPHEVTVTHRWLECDSVVPPIPPEQPQTPAPGALLRETCVAFAWPEVAGCDAYWIRVSRHPRLLYPYRVNYDMVVPKNSHLIPWRGMFSPEETYYWRIRPRLASGVWGEWSPVWTFQWEGPMVPRDIAQQEGKDGIVIYWKPTPRGTRPIRYDVYGSNERGFSVNKEPHEQVALGTVAGNFLGSTASTEMRVLTPEDTKPNMNRAYYRVVAVDARGVESCPSDYIELPRPHVYTRPVTTARAGQPYRYQLKTTESIGDLQHRYIPPGYTYWEKEGYRFHLESGPAWLSLDEATGLLTGTPPASASSSSEVIVRVSTHYPDEVAPESKNGSGFQKRRTDPTLKRETTHRFRLIVQE